MTHQLFADRIENVTVTGSLVRLDLGSFQPPKTADGTPTIEVTHRVVMPLEGLVGSIGALNTLVKKLIDDGVLIPKVASSTGNQQ